MKHPKTKKRPSAKKLTPTQRKQIAIYEEAERDPFSHETVLKYLGEIDAIALERKTKPDGVAVMLKINGEWIELIREYPSGNMAHTLFRGGIAHAIRMNEVEKWLSHPARGRRRRR